MRSRSRWPLGKNRTRCCIDYAALLKTLCLSAAVGTCEVIAKELPAQRHGGTEKKWPTWGNKRHLRVILLSLFCKPQESLTNLEILGACEEKNSNTEIAEDSRRKRRRARNARPVNRGTSSPWPL